MEYLLQHLYRFIGRRTQNKAVGPIKIFHRAAVGEEHRLRNNGGLQARVADGLFQSVGCAHGNGSDNGQNRRFWRQPDDAQRDVAQIIGVVFRQENHSSSPGKSFDVGGVGKASSPHVAPDDFLQILLEKRNVALCHFDHARTVGMTTRNRSSEIRQAG